MSYNFSYCNDFVARFEDVAVQLDAPDAEARLEELKEKCASRKPSILYYTGVDLGTACVVMAVLDQNKEPVAGVYQYADVVRDGMVVDYIGAIRLVQKMKECMEEVLGTELLYAAAAIPPGTDALDGGAVKNVAEAAGFEVTVLLDEPTAANKLLRMKSGAVVDIGGGTTGISVIQHGKVMMTDDEPTGGTHVSLVVAGAYHKPFEEAEAYKRNPNNHKELFPVVRPVMEKMATIMRDVFADFEEEYLEDIESIVLVGGTACFTGLETEVERLLGIPTYKPKNPLFVTPLGIALSCTNGEEPRE